MLLSIVNKVLNEALSQDKHSLKALSNYAGRCIEIIASDLNWTVYINIEKQGLVLKKQSKQAPDVVITGTVGQFLYSAYEAKAKQKPPRALSVSGDLHLAQSLSTLFDEWEFEWEARLARLTGDVLAHSIAKGARMCVKQVRQAIARMRRQTSEYIYYEAKLIPSQYELSRFCQDVDALRHRVDRMQARMNKGGHAQ